MCVYIYIYIYNYTYRGARRRGPGLHGGGHPGRRRLRGGAPHHGAAGG